MTIYCRSVNFFFHAMQQKNELNWFITFPNNINYPYTGVSSTGITIVMYRSYSLISNINTGVIKIWL